MSDAQAKPAAPRLAATVVVLRPAAEGGPPEVLMVRRARGASFMADAFVFPGGRVDDADHAAAGAEAGRPGGLGPYRIAAARELFEEASVRVEASVLQPFARWITPSLEPKRFDTYFFLAEVPAHTDAVVDATEVTEHIWATAAALIVRHDAGAIKLPPPTLRTLHDLAGSPAHGRSSISEIFAWARSLPLVPIQPKLVVTGAELAIVLPWDPHYADEPGEGVAIDRAHPLAGGVSRYVLRDGRFWAHS